MSRSGHRRRGGVPPDHLLARRRPGLPITGANIARAMQVSAPTVHEMIGRLEEDGYVTRAEDKSLAFTDSGREHARQIVRRHRLIERFLTDVFDIPWDQVHEEAERLEHWMSPVVEERMLRAIGDAKTCPHGHPIFEGAREHGRAARRRRGGRHRPRPALRERGRGPAPLPEGHGPAPGPGGQARQLRRRRGRDRRRAAPCTRSPAAWPRPSRSWPTLAAAAHRAAGPARAGPRALRPLARVTDQQTGAASGRARSRIPANAGRPAGRAAGRS